MTRRARETKSATTRTTTTKTETETKTTTISKERRFVGGHKTAPFESEARQREEQIKESIKPRTKATQRRQSSGKSPESWAENFAERVGEAADDCSRKRSGQTSGAGNNELDEGISDLQMQQQQGRSHYDNNNNNKGGKVQLMISPATRKPGSSESGKNQRHQMSRADGPRAFFGLQQQQQQQQQQGSQQPSYHHYDHYAATTATDSELASSMRQQERMGSQAASHYGDNILLFATEHSGSGAGAVSSQDGSESRLPVTSGEINLRPTIGRRAHSHRRSSNSIYSQPHHAQLQPQTGKFVDCYPSWRRAHSPAGGQHQNYSFHVPLQQQQTPQRWPRQARYGFVAPADRVGATEGGGGDNNDSRNEHDCSRKLQQSAFKSRTIAHIPGMLRLTTDEGTSAEVSPAHTMQMNASSSTYEDFYERPSVPETRLSLLQSEGDLLKAHVVHLTRDDGFDNPFKPGTELSWEADVMVRLIKRGYPIDELPVLVATAKQVALAADSQQAGAGQVSQSRNKRFKSDKNSSLPLSPIHTTAPRPTLAGGQANGGASDESSETRPLVKRASNLDLRAGKQVWANTLSRTKSMPRFTSSANYKLSNPNASDGKDADSLDKLILSIEDEMSNLLVGRDNEGELIEREENSAQHTSPAKVQALKMSPSKGKGKGKTPTVSSNNPSQPNQHQTNKRQSQQQQQQTRSKQQIGNQKKLAKGHGSSQTPAKRGSKSDLSRKQKQAKSGNNGIGTKKRSSCCIIQ